MNTRSAKRWYFTHEPYRDAMGFLPCDALGDKVYCVYEDGRLIGYSQLSHTKALHMAQERSIYLRTTRELYELAYDWCRAMNRYTAFGPANDGIAIMKRIPVNIRRAAARSYNARRRHVEPLAHDWFLARNVPDWLPF